MTNEQANAIRNAFWDLAKCVRSIDDEELEDMLVAREFACSSMAELERTFPELFPAEL